MEIIFDVTRFKPQTTLKIRSERDEIINNMLIAINSERVGTKYKPMTARGIAIKVAHLKGFELSHFYCMCQKAESFSRYFFGKLKIKPFLKK